MTGCPLVLSVERLNVERLTVSAADTVWNRSVRSDARGG
jgi:hypothetical protein